MMITPLHLRLHRCRGLLIDDIHEINKTAFLTQNAPYQIEQECPDTKDIALCFQKLPTGWWLINQSTTLRCAVNGKELPPHHRLRLNDADTLEWGLSVWHINPEDHIGLEPSMTHDAVAEVQNLSAVPLDLAWFDLRMRPLQEEGDPFDLVMPTESQEDRISPEEERPAQQDITPEAIFQQLHQEYLQALNAPHLVESNITLQDNVLRGETASSTSTLRLEALSGPLDPLLTLQDMVTGPLRIDEVFEGLDSLRETELFMVEEPPNVLQLFAPGWRPAQAHAQSPPQLTQKEHHAVSVDSHYRISQYQTDSAKDDKE